MMNCTKVHKWNVNLVDIITWIYILSHKFIITWILMAEETLSIIPYRNSDCEDAFRLVQTFHSASYQMTPQGQVHRKHTSDHRHCNRWMMAQNMQHCHRLLTYPTIIAAYTVCLMTYAQSSVMLFLFGHNLYVWYITNFAPCIKTIFQKH